MADSLAILPAANLRVDSTNPAALNYAAETNVGRYVGDYADGATRNLHTSFFIPANFLGAGTVSFTVRWYCTTNTGAVVLGAFYIVIGNTGSIASPSTLAAQTITVPATAGQIAETTFTTGSGSLANTFWGLILQRQGAAAGDTCTGTVRVVDIQLRYTSDATITKHYLWIPANAFIIPSGSGAALSTLATSSTTVINPYTLTFRDAVTDYADCRFKLPENYTGGLTITQVWRSASASANTVWQYSGARVAAGGSVDPALTAGTSFTVAEGPTFKHTAATMPALTPAAGEDYLLRISRLGADGSDASVTNSHLYGILVSYNVGVRSPLAIPLDPFAASQASTTVAAQTNTNSGRYVLQLVHTSDTFGDFIARIPAFYASGIATLRVGWKSASSSTNTLTLRADYGTPAVGATADPALTSSGDVAVANAGANLRNETTLTIDTGLVADDEIFIRLKRITGGGGDLAATVDITDVSLEVNIP